MKNIIDDIDDCLKNFIEREKNNLEIVESKPIIDLIETNIFGSGKRFRPQFCLFAYLQYKPDVSSGVIKLAAALELLHSFALIHDDIMDNSNTRRGKPTLHVLADSEAVGILAGDVTLVLADKLFYEGANEFSQEIKDSLISYYNKTKLNLCLGQYLDVMEEKSNSTTREKLFLMRHYKTGKYTIENPMHIGMIAAGVKDELLFDKISQFATYLGEAFQVRDDVVGLFGDEKELGKPVGDDIRSNKKTYIWQLLFIDSGLHLAAEDGLGDEIKIKENLEAVKGYFSLQNLSQKDVEFVQKSLIDLGLKQLAERHINSEYEKARSILDELNFDENIKELTYSCAFRSK